MKRVLLPVTLITLAVGLLVLAGLGYFAYVTGLGGNNLVLAKEEAAKEFELLQDHLDTFYTVSGAYPDNLAELPNVTEDQRGITLGRFAYIYNASKYSGQPQSDVLCRYELILSESSFFGNTNTVQLKAEGDKCDASALEEQDKLDKKIRTEAETEFSLIATVMENFYVTRGFYPAALVELNLSQDAITSSYPDITYVYSVKNKDKTDVTLGEEATACSFKVVLSGSGQTLDNPMNISDNKCTE
jgi:hypothetical protein